MIAWVAGTPPDGLGAVTLLEDEDDDSVRRSERDEIQDHGLLAEVTMNGTLARAERRSARLTNSRT